MTKPAKLFNRHFILLWQGQFVSQLGNQLHTIAMMFWIKHATGSASLMGTIVMVAMLPAVLLGPIGGTVADRFSRRRIIIVCDILRGLCVLSLAWMIVRSGETTPFLITYLFIIAVVMGICGAFFRPAISAAIPDLVPTKKVPAANSLNQSSMQVAGLVGQGLGGLLFRVMGAPLLFFIDGLSYIFSGISECFIKIPQPATEKHRSNRDLMDKFKQETAEGFRYVWRHKGMRNMFLIAAVLNFIMAPLGILLPFFVEDHLHTTSDWFGYILAGFGLGALVGYALAGLIKPAGKTRCTIVIIFLILTSLLLSALYWVTTPLGALILFTVFGAMNGLVNINIISILQMSTASEIRGRVFGLLGTLASGLSPISMGLAGVLVDATGHNIPMIYLITGILAALVTILVSLDRHFRDFLSYTPPAEEAVVEP